MSIRAIKWALAVKNIDATNKLALVAIAESHNDKTGDCFPSQKHVAEVISLTERPTRVRLNKLEADGFFTRKARYHPTTGKRTSDGYTLHFEVMGPTTGTQDSAGDDWTLPAELTAASDEPRLPAEAATGSKSLPEASLPAVSDLLPADSQPVLDSLYRKSRTVRDVAGSSESISLSRRCLNDPATSTPASPDTAA
jgi:hypothetical protein